LEKKVHKNNNFGNYFFFSQRNEKVAKGSKRDHARGLIITFKSVCL